MLNNNQSCVFPLPSKTEEEKLKDAQRLRLIAMEHAVAAAGPAHRADIVRHAGEILIFLQGGPLDRPQESDTDAVEHQPV